MRLSILILFFSLLSYSELVETFPNGIKKYDFSVKHKKISFIDSDNHFYLYDLENQEIEFDLQLDKKLSYRNFDFDSLKICMQKEEIAFVYDLELNERAYDDPAGEYYYYNFCSDPSAYL